MQRLRFTSQTNHVCSRHHKYQTPKCRQPSGCGQPRQILNVGDPLRQARERPNNSSTPSSVLVTVDWELAGFGDDIGGVLAALSGSPPRLQQQTKLRVVSP
ncbi:hypothetical protein J3459_015732 [Metarhizium acridum]|nr:hypothetical protein J3459_015732 [Metarhizium acridum]